MKRGPKKLPLSILKARKSNAQYNHNHKQPEPPAPENEPGCPSFLNKEAKAMWRRCIKSLRHMKVLSSADREALAGLCHSWSLYRRLAIRVDAINIEGWIGTQEELRIIKACDAQYTKYLRGCSLFGLTPSDRSNLTPNEDSAKKDGPPSMDEFLASKTA